MISEKISRTELGKLAVLLILISITVVYTVPWIVRNSLEKEYSGVDFHGYWYAGHYIRQGVNSFAAILNNPDPIFWDPRVWGSGNPYQQSSPEYSLKLPITYLDGHTVTEYPVGQIMIVVPAVTAPLNLLIGLFSWFSWDTARLIWLALNLTFALAIPWLAIRLTDRHQNLILIDKLIFALIFYNFYGLRQSFIVGQQTIICLFLLILALLFKDKNWMISGILLGFGISKYSVGLPVFIYFFLQRKYRALLTAVVIQVVAILMLVPFKWGSPTDTITAYLKVLDINYAQEGVHLLARISDTRIQTMAFLLILFPVIFLMIRRYFYRKIINFDEGFAGLNDLNIITLGIFLITYHRIHDMPFMIFFLLPAIIVLVEKQNFAFSRIQFVILIGATLAIISLLLFPSVPGSIVTRVAGLNGFTESWLSVDSLSSLSLLLMFVLSVWFYLKPSFDEIVLRKKIKQKGN